MGDPRSAAIGSVLERIAILSRTLFAESAGPFGAVTLTRSQQDALFHLAHADEDVTPGALARLLRITPGAVTQLVDVLREAGLVAQHPHPHDARSRVIVLSDSARRDVDTFEASVIALAEAEFVALETAEIHDLARLLARVGGGR